MTRRVTGDNSVDVAGLPPEVRSVLSSADTNGDGTASAAELVAMMAAHEGERSREVISRDWNPLMATLDRDGDGTVSDTEIGSAAQLLRKRDSDGNGAISPSELQADWNRE